MTQSETYIPGVCNIGKAEIAKRRAKLWTSLIILLGLSLLFLFIPFNSLLFAAINAVALYSFILIYQIRQKFCILFGWFHIFNFKNPGEGVGKVEEEEARKQDKRQVIKILLYSFFSAILYSVAISYLAKLF